MHQIKAHSTTNNNKKKKKEGKIIAFNAQKKSNYLDCISTDNHQRTGHTNSLL